MDTRRFVIGVDADARSMREASRRAARAGLTNAVFVVAAVETLPIELSGVAGLVTVTFPWGSLLRGLVGGEDVVIGAIGRLCRPGARVEAMWSIEGRDGGSARVTPLDRPALARVLDRHGMDLREMGHASPDEIAATRSTWAKRLRAATTRDVTRLIAVKR